MHKSTAFPFFISGYFYYLGKLLSEFYQLTATTLDDSVIGPSPLRPSISRPMKVHHHRPQQPAGDNVSSFYLTTSLDFRNSLTSCRRDEELWYLHNEGCSGRKHSTSILQEMEKAGKYFSSFLLSPEVEILSPKEPTAQRALPHFSPQPAAWVMRGTFTTSASLLLTANPKINAQGRSWIAAPRADAASKASERSACLCYPAPPPAHASLQTR